MKPVNKTQCWSNSHFWVDVQNLSSLLTNGHEVEVFVYAKTGHFSWFVARDCRKNSRAQWISTVSLVKVPNLYLRKESLFSFIVVHHKQ